MSDPAFQERASFGPDHRDIYLLIVGLVVGILLSPVILANINRDLYDRAFVGGVAEFNGLTQLDIRHNEAIDVVRRKYADQIEQLKQSGATPAAIAEKQEKNDRELAGLDEKHDDERKSFNEMYVQACQRHADMLAGYRAALILAVLAFMVIEALIDAQASEPWAQLRGRLASVRYALLAAWFAMLLAQPRPLTHVPFVLVGLLIVVGLLGASIPLRRRNVE